MINSTTGCDSVVTLDLTINNSNTGVDVQIACDSYTWIDGNTYSVSNNTATYLFTNCFYFKIIECILYLCRFFIFHFFNFKIFNS